MLNFCKKKKKKADISKIKEFLILKDIFSDNFVSTSKLKSKTSIRPSSEK